MNLLINFSAYDIMVQYQYGKSPHGGGDIIPAWDSVCLFTQLGMRRHNTLNICHSQSCLTFHILAGLGSEGVNEHVIILVIHLEPLKDK